MKFNATATSNYKELSSFRSNKDLKRTISDSTSAVFKTTKTLSHEINVEYLQNLLTEKYTIKIIDMHVKKLKRFIDSRLEIGFQYSEIDYIVSILDILQERIREQNEDRYKPIFLMFLDLFSSKPFIKQKMSDEIELVPKLYHLINVFSEIIAFDENKNIVEKRQGDLLISILNTIGMMCSNDLLISTDKFEIDTENATLKQRYSRNLPTIKAILRSNFVENLNKLIIKFNQNQEQIPQIINCIHVLTKEPEIAELQIGYGLLKDLIKILSTNENFRLEQISNLISVVYDIISIGGSDAIEQICNEDSVINLKSKLEQVISKSYKMQDKQIRNELVMLLVQISKHQNSYTQFLPKENTDDEETEFEKDKPCFIDVLLYYLTYDENNCRQQGKLQNQMFDGSSDDIEFKKICMLIIHNTSIQAGNNQAFIEILNKRGLIRTLLCQIDIENNTWLLVKQSEEHLKELQLYIMNLLINLIQNVPQSFVECKIGNVACEFLKQSIEDIEKQTLIICMLSSICKNPELNEEIQELGLIEQFVQLISLHNVNLKLKEYCLNSISYLCANHNRGGQKEFRRKNGIESLIEILNQCYSHEIVSQSNTNKNYNLQTYQVAVFNCVFMSIIENRRSELHFIECGGVSSMLYAFEAVPKYMKRICISILIELVNNPKAIEQWNDQVSPLTGERSTNIFIKAQIEEETRLAVRYNQGVLNHDKRPLEAVKELVGDLVTGPGGTPASNKRLDLDNESQNKQSYQEKEKQKDESTVLEKAFNEQESNDFQNIRSEEKLNEKIKNLSQREDIRPSIYSLLSKTKFEKHKVDEETRQRLLTCMHQPFLKKLEIWNNIKDELTDTNFRCTFQDQHWMLDNIEENQRVLQRVTRIQNDINQKLQKKQEEELDIQVKQLQVEK